MSTALVSVSVVAADSAFNADFYFAAATVIPVLLIAALLSTGSTQRARTLAERTFVNEVRKEVMLRQLGVEFNRTAPRRKLWRGFLPYMGLFLLLCVVMIGELCAFIALDNRHATPFEHFWVYVSVVLSALSVIGLFFVAPAHVPLGRVVEEAGLVLIPEDQRGSVEDQ